MGAMDSLYAQTVCYDILGVHEEGPAWLTGGTAAIAKLLGPNASTAFERKFRGSHMSPANDFYKPNLASEYPVVKKCFARLFFNDLLRNASYIDEGAKENLSPFSGLSNDESYQSQDLEKASQQIAKHLYDSKVQPSLLPKQVGNMHTASLYAAFASLIHNKRISLDGKWVVMFSYGSGLTSTNFSLKLQDGQHPFNLFNIAAVMNVSKKLKLRHGVFLLS